MRIAPSVYFRLRASVLIAVAGLCVNARPARAADSPWEDVANTLQTSDNFAGGYQRYNLPRKDITLKLDPAFVDISRKADIMSSTDKKGGRRTRRVFTEEFRAGAVRLVLDEGRSSGPGGHPNSSTCGHPKLLHLS